MKIINFAVFLTIASVLWVIASMLPDSTYAYYARGIVIAGTGSYIMLDVLERQQG